MLGRKKPPDISRGGGRKYLFGVRVVKFKIRLSA
jgi:hypothetical protein